MSFFITKRDLIFKELYLFLFVFCIVNLAHGEGYELPFYNSDLLTFFCSESKYALSHSMQYPEDTFQFGSGGFFDDANGNRVLEAATGFIFPVNKFVAIPIYFSALSNSPHMTYFPIFWPINPTYFEMFTGTGIIIYTKWLTLGAYVGYHGLTHFESIEEETNSLLDSFIGFPRFDLPVLSESRGINYAIVPIIKTNLWYLKKIENYFSTGKIILDNNSDENKSFDFKNIQFYTKLVIDGFNLFNQNRNSIEPYFFRGNYDWMTKNSIYGIRFGINHFVLEGGYRIFDENYNDSFFISGHLKYSAPSLIKDIFKNEECFVSLSIDNHYKKLGLGIADVFSQGGGNGIIMIEFVLNEQNNLSISFSEKMYINWTRK